ncbi:G-protein coupled receptors family 3 profile domain-containing protein [Plasmodiophora brassicae]
MTDGPCLAAWPCAATYPAVYPKANETNPPVMMGILLAVDINMPSQLATRALVEMAIRDVNADPTVLNGRTLVGYWGATTHTLKGGIFSTLQTGLADGNVRHVDRRVPLNVGPTFSLEAIPAALVSDAIGVSMLGSSCSTSQLSNKGQYPGFSRVYPPDQDAGKALANIIRSLGYRKIAIIARNDAWGVGVMTTLSQTASTLGIDVLAATQFDEDYGSPVPQLQIVKASGARIIVSFVFDPNRFFSALDDLDMLAPKYLHIGGDGWSNEPLTDATAQRMRGSFYIIPTVDTSSDTYTHVFTTYSALYNQNSSLTYGQPFSALSPYDLYFYDAVRFGALAYDHFWRRGVDPLQVPEANMTRQLRAQSMNGLSGPIQLNAAGDRLGNYEVYNCRPRTTGTGYEMVPIAEYVLSDSRLVFEGGRTWYWATRDGSLPLQEPRGQAVFHTLNATTATTLQTLSGLGLVVSAIVAAFNVKYRGLPYIKMSSPVINNVILLGCITGYVQIIVMSQSHLELVSDSAFTSICTAQVTLMVFAFTLMFGGLFAKTYRVFKIFGSMQVVKITNGQLIGSVFIMLLIDSIALATWFGSERLTRLTTLLETYASPTDPDVILQPTNVTCYSPHQDAYVGFLLLYKGVVMLAGAFIAFRTKDVSIPALNDSKQIGAAIYTVALISAIAYLVLRYVPDPSVQTVITAAAIWFCVSCVVAFLFVPKMMAVARGEAETLTKKTGTVLTAPAKNLQHHTTSNHTISGGPSGSPGTNTLPSPMP